MATASVTFTFVALTDALASEVNTNFSDVVSFLNTQTIHKDASVAFTAVPSGPATDPVSDNQFVRKAYVDRLGIIRQQSLTAFSPSWNVSQVTDMLLSNVSVIAGRTYAIHLHTQMNITAGGSWDVNCRVNGSQIGKFRNLSSFDGTDMIDSTVYWQPSVTASTDDVDVFAQELSGGAALQFQASADTPRTLTIIDLGVL